MKMTQAELETVLTLIGKADVEQLRLVSERGQLQRTFIGNQTRRSLATGDTVSFTGRRGLEVVGVVKKINIKNVVVSAGTTNWRVPANLLKKVG
ncbi:hypothetical protein N9R43_00875 [bacterium]|nr:hypothetical protein [bacterium]